MLVLNSEPIKVWSSCALDLQALASGYIESNKSPSEGDLVLVRIASGSGVYNTMEDPNGRDVQLYEEDVCIGVLGPASRA
jgi:hypothetical protein